MIIFTAIVLNLQSQIPEILWQQCYGTNENDYTWAISTTENGYWP